MGGLWGIVASVLALITMHNMGALEMMTEGAAGYVYFGQLALGTVLNICAIVLAPIVFSVTEGQE